MKRVVLIVNPHASSVTPARARDVEAALRSAGNVATQLTEHARHAVDLAAAAAGDVDAVVVFSGDGTYNEVLNGLSDGTAVGFVPGGGSNVLPRALGLPRDPAAASARVAEALAADRTRRISLGRAGDRRFAFAAGIGIDAELVRRVDAYGRNGGRRPGDAVFVWTFARLLAERRGRFEPELEIRGVGRAAFALVANGDPYTYLGRLGLHFAPHARFEAGLDVVAPVAVRAHDVIRFLVAAAADRSNAREANIRYLHDVEAVEVVCDAPMPLQVDGEDLGDVEQVAFSAERDAVDVLV